MSEEVGPENMFIFGARVEDLDRIKQEGSYNPKQIAESDERLAGALKHLTDGSLPTSDGSNFEELYRALVPNGDGRGGDQYFVLLDFDAYDKAFWDAIALYRQPDEWVRKAVLNTAKSAYFSSDRTIDDYNENIWHLTPVTAEELAEGVA